MLKSLPGEAGGKLTLENRGPTTYPAAPEGENVAGWGGVPLGEKIVGDSYREAWGGWGKVGTAMKWGRLGGAEVRRDQKRWVAQPGKRVGTAPQAVGGHRRDHGKRPSSRLQNRKKHWDDERTSGTNSENPAIRGPPKNHSFTEEVGSTTWALQDR